MKPTFFAFFAALAFAGCGPSEIAQPTPAPPPGATAPPLAPPAGPPARTLVDKPTMGTSLANLVNDPDFQSLWTPLDETGFGLYEAFLEDGKSEVRFVADSPRGPGAAVLTVKPSSTARLTMMVMGGRGPLTAEIWVADRGGSVTPEIVSLFEARELPLVPVVEDARTVDGVRFVPYRRVIDRDLPGRLYLSVSISGAGGALLTGPEVVAKTAASGHRVRSVQPERGPGAATAAAMRFEALRNKLVSHAGAPPRPAAIGGLRD
jgi:hypothetical protein